MKRKSQCEEKLAEILDLVSRGRSRKEIARDLGLSANAVSVFLYRRGVLGLPRNLRVKRLDDQKMLELLASGLTQQETAERLGFERSAIYHRLMQLYPENYGKGSRSGPDHPSWLGGRRGTAAGYMEIWVPKHPSAGKTGYVYEHRLLMEVLLDRPLESQEVVHHIDRVRCHNWPSNLQLFPDNASHQTIGHSPEQNAIHGSLEYGAVQSTQGSGRYPGPDETLAQCPLEIRAKLDAYIATFRPTTQHRRTLPQVTHQIDANAPAEDQ